MQNTHASPVLSDTALEHNDSQLSAALDGEIAESDWIALSKRLDDGVLVARWQEYQLIGDCLRDTPQSLSEGFHTRFSAALAAEPTVLAPRRRWGPRAGYALAASVALLAGGMAWLNGGAPDAGEAVVASAAPEPASMPAQFQPYVLAHEDYAPAQVDSPFQRAVVTVEGP
jgi:sigma-E factor negative regulatory protein RseA